MTENPRLRGVYAAALTPLNDDLGPDLKSLVRHYKWLLANGCDGLAPLGTTGEANSFSVDERLSVIDTLGGSGIPMDRCIVGTGSCALTDSVRLTKRVLDAGGRDVLVLPPFYYKKVTDDGLFASFAEVIQRVGDARLRLYIYQFPQMTGLDLSLDLIGRLIDAFPKTVVGIKDSSGNWPNMEAMCKRFPGFEVFPGSERFLLSALKAGGVGCISATTNVTAPMAAKVYAGWRGDKADALQAELTAVRDILEAFPPIAALKQLLARTTGQASWFNIRPPLLRLTDAQAQALFAKLEAVSFETARAA
ncbi:MAG: dihydrodipicolinate synthase family protein [Alphaproteobacteria bacterium]